MQLSPLVATLIARTRAADAARDADAFAATLTPDARFAFAGSPEVIGREAIRTAVAAFFAQVASMRHDLLTAIESEREVAYRAVVHYTRLDGSVVAIPYCNYLRHDGELFTDYRIYIDLAPLLVHPGQPNE